MSRLLTFPLSLILSLGILFSLNHCGSDDIPPLSGNPSSPGNVDPLGPKTKTDDHGNAQARATPVTNGMAVIGNIETDDDQDYFSIAVAGAGTLRAFTTGDVNTIGILYDSDGTELAKNNKDGADMNFDISYDVTSAGIYYVRVTSPGTNTRPYSLTVTFTTAPDPSDDHSNTEAYATPVTSGMPIDGNLETRDDQDYFSIAVAGAGTLRAFTTGDVNTIGTLYDSDGIELASDVSVGNFNISHYINSITRTSMSTYYIRVASFGGGEGEYSLTVIFISDDHRNDISRATVAASGMPIDGNLTRDDQDYFSIVVTGAGTLRAFTRGGVNTIGALYDSDGTELASDVSVGNFNISHYINSITRTSMSTYYIRVTSFGGGEGEYSLTVTFISDDHRNDISSATPVTSGMLIDGNLETRDDQDYFSIAVTEAGTLRAFTTGDVNTIGTLYDSDGTELASDDDGGTNTNFDVSHFITTAGTYYISVTSFGGGEGEYSLTVTFISDDHSNDISSATPVTNGMPIDGNLETRDDQDYFSIAVAGAGTLRAFTTGGANTIGTLYDSDGTELASDDDGGTDVNFAISHYITSAGTYYIRVTSFGGGEGEYSLTVTFISDDHRNDISSATPVTSGMLIDGNLETRDDQDYFSIAVTGAGTLRAFTTGGVNTIGTLYDTDGTELASDDDGGTDVNFAISHYITSAGAYYISVTSFGGGEGEYSLTVTFISDDHRNDISSATPVTSGMPIDGNLETRDDQDYFSIAVTGAGTLRAFTTGGVNTIGTLYDNDGTELASDDDGGTDVNFAISHDITSAGTYYIRVTSFGGGEGEYSLTVTFISDDHRNDISRATVAASGMPIDGNLTRDDQDYFSIVVAGAGTLRAFTTGGVNTIGTLYDSDETELASDDDGGTNTNFEISHYITSAGTYYIRVTSFGGGEGEYSLTVTFISDDHRNDISSATVVTSGMLIDGNLETRDDQDYFSIVVAGAGTLRAFTTGGVNTIGTLYDSDETELASDDDGGTNTNFDVSHYITSAGTYYIRVTSFGGGEGEYSLTVTFISDDHRNDISSATVVTSGMLIDGNLETRDDQDYFSIVVAGAGTLRAFTTGGVNTIGTLYDSDETELASDDDGGTNTNFEISHYITSAGTYYIRVTSFGGGEGEYSLTVTFISDDHRNDISRATVVTSSMPIDGNLETRDDQDYFSIAVTGAGTLRAFTTGGVNTIGTLYDSDGDELATNDNGGTNTNFDVSHFITTDGTYYVRVISKGSDTGTYSLTVTFTPASTDSGPTITFMYPAAAYTSNSCDGMVQVTPTLTPTSLEPNRLSITISPALPAGIEISSRTGEISGMYANDHSQNYVVKVIYDGVEAAQADLTLTINPLDDIFHLDDTSYPEAVHPFKTGTSSTISIRNPNPSRELVFSVSTPLPSGLSLDANTGDITGSPTSELGNTEHMVQVASGSCSKEIPLRFCANQDGNCPPRFLPEKRVYYADVVTRVFPTDESIDWANASVTPRVIDSLLHVKSFVDDNGDDFTITIMSQTNNNFHPRRPTRKYKYKYKERPEESADGGKLRRLYLFDSGLNWISRWWHAQIHRLHHFTTDTVTLKATDANGRSTVGTIEIRRSPKLKDCTGLTGDALDECTWLSEILPSGWESNTLTDAVKNKLPNLTQDKDNYRLVFAEEFNGDGDSNHHNLDRKKWRLNDRHVWDHNPSAVRNDCFIQVKDGTLQISLLSNCPPKGAVGLSTVGLFEYRYGYIEIKFKIPINKPHTSPGRGYYTNYAGVLWGRYGGSFYNATPVVTIDSIEKYLKYEFIEWDLYEYVPRDRTIYAHWYYPRVGRYNKFLIPQTTIDRLAHLCVNNLSTARDPNPMTQARRNQLKKESRKESTFLEGCNSALPTTVAQAPAQDRFVTLTRGWEWTPKGYRNFSHYETDNENDKTRYPDLFSDSPKTSHWQMYKIKYRPYSNTNTFTRATSQKNLRREAPYITSRDDNDQLLEIGVSHQPMIFEITTWAQGVWGGFRTPPAGTVNPHVFHIDYVRVYKPVDNYKDVEPSYQFTPTDDQSRCQVSGSSNC